MLKRKCFFIGMVIFLLQGCVKNTENFSAYVNVFIGTARGGNQVPGPCCPFGMVKPSPLTKPFSHLSATVYEKKDSLCYGFSLVNLIGTGCDSYGGVVVSPVQGTPDVARTSSPLASEKAEVGYYAADLPAHHIRAELTASARAVLMRFSLPQGTSSLLVDLSRINTQDTLFYLHWLSETELEGMRTDGQFCGKPGTHILYFYVRFYTPPAETGILVNNVKENVREKRSRREKLTAFALYQMPGSGQAITMAAGISYVSCRNARMNFMREIGGKPFEVVQHECREAWNQMLSRIEVEDPVDSNKVKFYTALYHTMSHPNILNDVNGEYPAMETGRIMKVKGRNRFTVYSLWDTYRTLHPFFTLVYPEVQSQMVKSMLDMYHEYGWLPHWELISREKGVMNGDPALIVINDTWQKGIRDFDAEDALCAMIHNARETYRCDEADRKGVEYIRKAKDVYWQYGGYIPQDYKDHGGDVWGVVATTEEYNLADWNLAQFARSLGKEEVYHTYMNLSKGYAFFFDSSGKFMRRRYANGQWAEPFDPFARSGEMSWPYSGGPGYTEGHAWHYLFFVPHDIPGLIRLMGGEQAFVQRLQMCFDSGYYMPDNEPDIAYPFLFNYVKGEEWRTQQQVRKLINKEFYTGPGGIPGNDDTGTMSAWLLFAMMGFYPDCPGSAFYQLCSPVFNKVTIHLTSPYHKGKTFVIRTRNNHQDNVYIQSVSLNGKPWNAFQVPHEVLTEGGEMVITLGKERVQ